MSYLVTIIVALILLAMLAVVVAPNSQAATAIKSLGSFFAGQVQTIVKPLG